MKLFKRLHGRKVVAVLVLLMGLGLAVPHFFRADRYRSRLESGLERAMGRHATFGAMAFRLLPRPGFSIENVVIPEDRDFGIEPFARVDRIDCDLRIRSLLSLALDISRLHFERPSFNAVRNEEGRWNFQTLWRNRPSSLSNSNSASPGTLQVELNDARVDFKAQLDKKPFAITDVSAQLNFDRARGRLAYRLTGSPLRTDLALPTPGQIDLRGEWTPGADFAGPLDATLETQGALLYDWVPVVSGRNPEIFGVVDASFHLTGSVQDLRVDGRTRISQLHRADQPPPTEKMNAEVYLRGGYKFSNDRLLLDSVDVSFADSRIHLSGSVDEAMHTPVLDLVVAVERSRLEDFQGMAARFTPQTESWSASGRVDALITVQGPWSEKRYGGFVDIGNVSLITPDGTYPVSEINLRIDKTGMALAPVRLTLSPRVELVAEGKIFTAPSREKTSSPFDPHYELSLAAKAVPLHDLLGLARGVGVKVSDGVDARGTASTNFKLSGALWPLAKPDVEGQLDFHAARLLIPGLTEPLNVPKAHVQVSNRTITASPVVAVIGTSVFTGQVTHRGERKQPWKFNVRANNLSVEQGALWFDVLGNRAPVPLLERLPGIRSLVERRAVASGLFTALNASGRFTTPKLTYRAVTLYDFQSAVEIRDRVVHVEDAVFHAGGGRGKGSAVVNLTQSPAQVTTDFSLVDARLQPMSPFLPAAVRSVRGMYSAQGHFETLGLSRGEMVDNLQGRVAMKLANISFGDFDLLQSLARASGEGIFEPAPMQVVGRNADLSLEFKDRRVVVAGARASFSGARVLLNGNCSFDGAVDMNLEADLRELARRWSPEEAHAGPRAKRLSLHVGGTLERPVLEPHQEISRANP
jgi:uncharacterized protein involved in outer membrane biogenesis